MASSSGLTGEILRAPLGRSTVSTSALVEAVVGASDLARRRRFYEEALGLEVVRRGTVDGATAAALWGAAGPVETVTLGRLEVPGSPRVRLVASTGAESRRGRDLRVPGPLGIGVTTRGVRDVFDRVAAAGVDFVSPPLCLTPGAVGAGPMRYEAFGRAADGEFVVLIERVGVPTPYGTISESFHTSEPLHSSHVVPDLEAAARFMAEALGQESLMRDRCQGPIFEELMGVPEGTAFRFEMLHHPGYPTGRIVLIEFEGHAGPAPAVDSRGRGLIALRYDCDDLDVAAARIAPAGGAVLRGPVDVDSGALGRGRVLLARSPFGTLFEIWEVKR
jgi:catechol 2,3-dioxygenase-like lactoylglutathione lyase family enzyme